MADDSTRINVGRILAEVVARCGGTSRDVLARPEEVTTVKMIALLALVLGDQERRLRVLEPCAESGGRPHVWLDGGVCGYCEVRK